MNNYIPTEKDDNKPCQNTECPKYNKDSNDFTNCLMIYKENLHWCKGYQLEQEESRKKRWKDVIDKVTEDLLALAPEEFEKALENAPKIFSKDSPFFADLEDTQTEQEENGLEKHIINSPPMTDQEFAETIEKKPISTEWEPKINHYKSQLHPKDDYMIYSIRNAEKGIQFLFDEVKDLRKQIEWYGTVLSRLSVIIEGAE